MKSKNLSSPKNGKRRLPGGSEGFAAHGEKVKKEAGTAEERGLLRYRNMARKAIVVSGIAAAAGIICYKGLDSTKPDMGVSSSAVPDQGEREADVHPQLDKIGQVDLLIGAAGKNMENLRKAYLAKTSNSDRTREKELMEQPFVLMDVNKGNPNKNVLRIEAMSNENGPIVRNMDINYFNYGLAEDTGENIEAEFVPMSRTMKLPLVVDENNLLNALIMYHELHHVLLDTAVRSRIHSKEEYDAYNASFMGPRGSKGKIDIVNEGSCYAYEIEMLNILLDGKVKRGEVLDLKEVRVALNAGGDQLEMIELILELAKAYYDSGSSLIIGLNRAFLEEIASKYDPRTTDILWK